MIRRLLIATAALWLLLCVGVATAADARVMIRDAMLDEYPRVKLQLSIPGNSDERSAPQFAVAENGRQTEILSTEEIKSDPVDVVLVLDTSGSMQGRSLIAAKNAAEAFIRELQPGSRVGVIAISDRPRVVVPIGSATPSMVGSSVRYLSAQGETALYDALNLAGQEVSRAQVKRPVVVLLSDGGDTVSRTKLDAAIKGLRSANAPVLVVALPSAEADYGVLRSVASQTGGRFASIKSADSLVGVYQGLARQLQTGWNLTYVSRRPSTKDLDIEVTAGTGTTKAVGSLVVPNPLFTSAPADANTALEPVPPASMITLFGAAALVFVAIFSGVVALALLLVQPKTGLDHMKYYDQAPGTGESADAAQDYSGQVTGSLLNAMDYVAGKGGLKKFAYDQLDRAGLPLRPTEYITIHALVVIASGMIVQALTGNLLASLLVVLIATMLPIVWINRKIASRKAAFELQLPDVLNLIAGSLRAGWGLQQAIDLVVEQMAPPMSVEFSRAQTEIRLGRPVEEALETVAQRTQSEDFSWAVTAIGIQRDVGGNLAEVLDVVAATIRDRASLKRQIDSLTAEGRLSAWVLLILPFVMVGLLWVVNPTYLQKLFTSVQGLAMLCVGAILLIIGALWMRRIVEIEV